jgi:hypothetical protein
VVTVNILVVWFVTLVLLLRDIDVLENISIHQQHNTVSELFTLFISIYFVEGIIFCHCHWLW